MGNDTLESGLRYLPVDQFASIDEASGKEILKLIILLMSRSCLIEVRGIWLLLVTVVFCTSHLRVPVGGISPAYRISTFPLCTCTAGLVSTNDKPHIDQGFFSVCFLHLWSMLEDQGQPGQLLAGLVERGSARAHDQQGCIGMNRKVHLHMYCNTGWSRWFDRDRLGRKVNATEGKVGSDVDQRCWN